ncbi:DUF4354 family protein [Yersinia sp. Marseille-Q3913]|uniref:DUF4354 family protein n=1 Tax=Yersinia sp. Marseille-Q3913 TaxID=2830769 RepID=UPI002011E474|nr:DUF4354 family protein [Yersinia sp. Marseille-Q3913]
MKQWFAFITLFAISFVVSASTLDSIRINAQQGALGTMTIGERFIYTKRFDIELNNAGEKAIDLNNICFNVYAPNGEKFNFDTVDAKLVEGSLKPNASVKGFVVFSSQNDSVYKAKFVKISTNC